MEKLILNMLNSLGLGVNSIYSGLHIERLNQVTRQLYEFRLDNINEYNAEIRGKGITLCYSLDNRKITDVAIRCD